MDGPIFKMTERGPETNREGEAQSPSSWVGTVGLVTGGDKELGEVNRRVPNPRSFFALTRMK